VLTGEPSVAGLFSQMMASSPGLTASRVRWASSPNSSRKPGFCSPVSGSVVVVSPRSSPGRSLPPNTVPPRKSTFSPASPRTRNSASPATVSVAVSGKKKNRYFIGLRLGRAKNRIIFSSVSHRLCSQKSKISRVMYSDVNRLMTSPTVSAMANPLSWSLPNV
jgi:hypothetical protein